MYQNSDQPRETSRLSDDFLATTTPSNPHLHNQQPIQTFSYSSSITSYAEDNIVGYGCCPSCILWSCQALRLSTAVLLLLLLLAQTWAILQLHAFTYSLHGIYTLMFQIYSFLFTVVAICCELEVTETIRSTTLLQFWTTRGLFYVFIALLATQQYDSIVILSLWRFPFTINYLVHPLLLNGVLYAVLVSAPLLYTSFIIFSQVFILHIGNMLH